MDPDINPFNALINRTLYSDAKEEEEDDGLVNNTHLTNEELKSSQERFRAQNDFMTMLYGFPISRELESDEIQRARRRINMLFNLREIFEIPTTDELLLRDAMHRSILEYTMKKKNISIEVKLNAYKSLNNKLRDAFKFCSICHDDFQSSEQVAVLECCYCVFHEGCIREWGQYKPQCPLCREEISHNTI